MTECRVLLFSLLAEAVGKRELVAAVELPCSAGALVDSLAKDSSPIRAYRHVIRVAVNREYVPETHVIRSGDEVAIITPTSGG